MKRFLRWIIWGTGGLLIVALTVVALRPQPVLVDVALVTRGPLQVTVDEDGLTRIKERYVVSTPIAGRLERISLEVGDAVVADTTVIASMQATDPSLLDPRAVAQAEARVKAAEHRHEAAQAEHNKALSAEEYAKNELDRARNLETANALAESEVEAKEMEHQIRQEESRAAAFRVDIAQYELKLEKAALLLTHPAEDERSPGDVEMELAIKAPIHGRVLRIYRESAAVLDAGASILEIGDPLDLEVVVDVLSVNAISIHPGDEVRLENWGGAAPLIGKVRVVEPSGFTKLSALGVEEQRVNVIIDIVDPKESRTTLGDGFRVEARVIVWSGEDILQVPTSALFRVKQDWALFHIDDNNKARLSVVEVGHNNGIQAEVLSGIDEGTTIIVHPSDAISDGVAVELRNE